MADGAGSKVVVHHAIPADAPFPIDDPMGGECGVFKEMWAYTVGLLKTWLELGEAKCRLHPDRKPEHAVTHEMTIASDAKTVFAALTEPDRIKAWNCYAPAPAVDKRVGGRYSFGWKSEATQSDGPGEVVEYEEGHKITYTWFGDPPTIVSWTVDPLPDDPKRTRLRFVHSGFAVDQNMLVGWNLGWRNFLHAIALYLERGTAPTWVGEAA